MVETVISDYMSPQCDLDLEDRKPLFLHDALAHDDASPYQLWLQKVQQLRRYRPDEHLLEFSTFLVTFTFTTTRQSNFFHNTIQLMMIYHNFGCKISSSVDMVETVISDYICLHCDLDLEGSEPSFWKTIWLMIMHHHTKFGCKRLSDLGDI